jgi:hypothetical protein
MTHWHKVVGSDFNIVYVLWHLPVLEDMQNYKLGYTVHRRLLSKSKKDIWGDKQRITIVRTLINVSTCRVKVWKSATSRDDLGFVENNIQHCMTFDTQCSFPK